MSRIKWAAAGALLVLIIAFATSSFDSLRSGIEVNVARVKQGALGLIAPAQGSTAYYDSGDNWTELVKVVRVGLCLGNGGPSNNPKWEPRRAKLYTGYTAGTPLTGATAAETAMTMTGEGAMTLPPTSALVGVDYPIDTDVLVTCDNTGTETFELRGYIGTLSGTKIFDTGALNVHVASVTNSQIHVEGHVYISTAGATGAGYAKGTITYLIGAGTSVCVPFYATISPFDWTATPPISISGDWGGTTAAPDTATMVSENLETTNYD